MLRGGDVSASTTVEMITVIYHTSVQDVFSYMVGMVLTSKRMRRWWTAMADARCTLGRRGVGRSRQHGLLRRHVGLRQLAFTASNTLCAHYRTNNVHWKTKMIYINEEEPLRMPSVHYSVFTKRTIIDDDKPTSWLITCLTLRTKDFNSSSWFH